MDKMLSKECYMNLELEKFKDRVLSYRGTLDDLAFGRGNSCDLTFNATTNSSIESPGVEYVVYLCPFKEVFIVWDYGHRKQVGCSSKSFSVGGNRIWEDVLSTKDHPITWPYYKGLKCKKGAAEKVYIVQIRDEKSFFMHLEEYMDFNFFDEDKLGNKCWKSVWNEFPENIKRNSRKEYSSIRRQRAADFRKKVLTSYGNKCAICRCELESVLQAAHLHGHEVACTSLSEDIPQHGICLCANHHLMYDANIIDIDIETAQLIVEKELKKNSTCGLV